MYRNETPAQASRHQQQAGDTGAYFAHHDFDGPAKLTTTLVHALSDVSGIDVTDTGFTLADHVDPDALDQLFKPKADGTPRTNSQLTFPIGSYQVTIYGDGQIAIVPPRRNPPVQG